MTIVRAPSGGIDRRDFLKLLGVAAAATAIAVTVPFDLADEPALTDVEIDELERQVACATFGALRVGVEIFKRTGDPVSIAYHVAAFWASTDRDIRQRYPREAERILEAAGDRVAEQIGRLNDEMDRRRA